MSAPIHWLYKRITMTPDALALVDADSEKTWTYREFGKEIEKWRTFFESNQLSRGDRVALLASNQMDSFAILFACSYAGFIFTPINTRLHDAEIELILQDATPAMVLVTKEFQTLINHTLWNVIAVDRALDEQENLSFSESSVSVHPEEISVMIYTGGTTGVPKGVLLSNRAIEWNAINTIVSWGLTAEDKTLTYMPLFHTGGINALAIPLLLAGGQIVIGRKFEAAKVLDELNHFQITIALFVPTMYQMMIQSGHLESRTFPTMKTFLSGGAPCALSIYHYFEKHQFPFKQGYGLSEAGPNNFMMPLHAAQQFKGSVGKPMVYAEIELRDEEGLVIEASDVPGEIWIRGPHLFSGYWQRLKETEDVFYQGWFKTGDIGIRNAEGYYTIKGRKKEMIISGGENIYPQEIETILNQLSGIDEQAVIGQLDEKWGEVPVAFVTVSDPAIDGTVIKEHCAQYLSKFKCPAHVYVVEELPKTAVGKLDKRLLEEWAKTRPILN